MVRGDFREKSYCWDYENVTDRKKNTAAVGSNNNKGFF